MLFNKNNVEEVLEVEGMKCEHCAARVKEALKKINVKAQVSLEEKKVRVSYNSNKVNQEQIKNQINELGFKCL